MQCDEKLLISYERYDTGNLSHTHKIIIDQLANRWLIQDANELLLEQCTLSFEKHKEGKVEIQKQENLKSFL